MGRGSLSTLGARQSYQECSASTQCLFYVFLLHFYPVKIRLIGKYWTNEFNSLKIAPTIQKKRNRIQLINSPQMRLSRPLLKSPQV